MTEHLISPPAIGPAAPSRRRKSRLAIVVALVLIVGAGIAVFVLEPWKKINDLPDSVGTLSIFGVSGFDVPPSIDQGIIPGRNLLLDRATDTTSQRYQDQAAEDQPVYVFIAVLDNPDPEALVADIFRLIQDPKANVGGETFALSDVKSFGGWANSGYPHASRCGSQPTDVSADTSQLAFGERFSFTELVVCSWADQDTAGIAVFMNRDVEASIANLRIILAAAYS